MSAHLRAGGKEWKFVDLWPTDCQSGAPEKKHTDIMPDWQWQIFCQKAYQKIIWQNILHHYIVPEYLANKLPEYHHPTDTMPSYHYEDFCYHNTVASYQKMVWHSARHTTPWTYTFQGRWFGQNHHGVFSYQFHGWCFHSWKCLGTMLPLEPSPPGPGKPDIPWPQDICQIESTW